MTQSKSTTTPGRPADVAKFTFEQYGDGLLRFLLRCRGCEQDADDLAQEVYMELLRVSETEVVRQPQAYMYRIASHVVYRFRRRKQRENALISFDSETVAGLGEQTSGQPAEGTGAGLDAEREIERLLQQLPPLYQAIILMQKRDGLSYAQIAEKLGISIHTVKKYLHRGLVQLRQSS